MKKEIEKTQKITEYYCDVCGRRCHNICQACGKDICSDHRIFDDRDPGDYLTSYCFECWQTGRPYRDQQHVIEQETDNKIAELEKQWYQLCKIHNKSKEIGKEKPAPSCASDINTGYIL